GTGLAKCAVTNPRRGGRSMLRVIVLFGPAAIAVIAAARAVWWFGRCRHPRPLGLVPPVVDAHGERQPARWFCGQCGEYWPAVFEHEHAPIQRFHGYDESKARESAKRAAALEQRQRELAVRRAGMTTRQPDVRPSRPHGSRE